MSAITFDSATTQYTAITDGNQTNLDIITDWTIEFWAQCGTVSGTDYIVAKEDSGGDRPYAVWRTTSSGLRAAIYDASGGNTTEAEWTNVTNPDNSGDWDHFAITCDISAADATKFELYKNGVSQGNGNVTVSGGAVAIFNGDGSFVIGGRSVGGNQYDGSLYDVRVWTDIRTSTEVGDNYNAPFTRPDTEANLVGNWYKAGEHHVDSSSSENALTPAGEITWSADPGLLLNNAFGTEGGTTISGGPSVSGTSYPRMGSYTAVTGTVGAYGHYAPTAIGFRMAPYTAISGTLTAAGTGGGVGVGVQYRMRGFDQSIPSLVFWTSDVIDFDALDYDGDGPVVDIVVHKIVGD